MDTSISIIIPCYNYGEYLEEAIESIYRQTVLPEEIIAVDDCSTDNTAEILKRHPLIKYIKHDKNRGLSAARNTGVRASTSNFCFSFDADDILRPETVERYKDLSDRNTIVTCGLMAFGAESYTARPEKASLEILLTRNCIYSNSLFPKGLWEKVGGFDEHMLLGLEDWECWIRMAEAGAEFIPDEYIALLWRRHSKAMSTSMANPNWKKNIDYMRQKHKHLYSKYNM